MAILFLIFALAVAAQSSFQPYGQPFKAPVNTPSGIVASVLFTNLTSPRGVTVDALGNVLVVERGIGVSAFSPSSDGLGTDRALVISNTGVTHGIVIEGSDLYISTATQVLAFAYDAGTKTVQGSGSVIVENFPVGELTTHALLLDKSNILVGTGPGQNIDPSARDPSSGWSQIRKFPLAVSSPTTWLDGDLIAYGIRNPAGFAYHPVHLNNLYVVENGASIDNVTGMTAAFVNDNPADELEVIETSHSKTAANIFYGFPDCTTIWNPTADPAGVPQYADYVRGEQFSLQLLASRDDTWCQDKHNNHPPQTSFQAHSVPLDIKFYSPVSSKVDSKALPVSWANNAFATFHGSFNRSPPTGYSVVRLPKPGVKGSSYLPVVEAANLVGCPSACQSIRPAGLAFGANGKLYVTSDSSGELFVVESA
ncbi:hypothetical protein DL96DRAFT_1596562 [Flagelloscypha sp. PMI_526]|nr:hypothetical protein DL96DRAFT_1596562 [Flagelloscypha sp. PMI_526]